MNNTEKPKLELEVAYNLLIEDSKVPNEVLVYPTRIETDRIVENVMVPFFKESDVLVAHCCTMPNTNKVQRLSPW
ncbi:hypothetical protein ACE1B6_24305 [Aerosakkonemataceae cyanobacterium BLCC-F154]|uniref:Quinolinate synthase n=1 Tax=Floridaenema fluviatile BLCC-F154 TaxID=3153640 RepID=A0ABV4YHY3_9CYAN